jgi:multidrug efflux pump subunit AcrA (membrane-fusion protein)
VAKRGDRSVVFVADEKNVVKEVDVKPAKLGDPMEVQGVKAGEKVVLAPPEKLKSGATVAIAKK